MLSDPNGKPRKLIGGFPELERITFGSSKHGTESVGKHE